VPYSWPTSPIGAVTTESAGHHTTSGTHLSRERQTPEGAMSARGPQVPLLGSAASRTAEILGFRRSNHKLAWNCLAISHAPAASACGTGLSATAGVMLF
jgi:hypothetical protein